MHAAEHEHTPVGLVVHNGLATVDELDAQLST
jgi:hypothetical protein